MPGRSLIWFIVLGALVFAVLLHHRLEQEAQAKHGLAHAIGHTQHHIGNLQSSLAFAAVEQPRIVREYVRNGISTDAILIPTEIATNFIWDVMTPSGRAEILRDSWGNPLHLKIAPHPSLNETNGPIYDLFIWSDGPNRSNEFGKGDDITSGNATITGLPDDHGSH